MFYIPFLTRTRYPSSAFIPFFKYREPSRFATPVARYALPSPYVVHFSHLSLTVSAFDAFTGTRRVLQHLPRGYPSC